MKIPPRIKAFLSVYSESGNVSKAAEAAGISRYCHYRRLKSDPVYQQLFEAAEEQAGDVLVAEAWRRAVEGVQKPVYQGGQLVGLVQEYSDGVLLAMLKAFKPKKFNPPAKSEVSGPDGAPIETKLEVVFVRPPA